MPSAGGARVLLSVMMANNETGVIQPVAEAAAMAREHGVALHIDAVQAPGRLPLNFAELGADTLVVSAHKLGGPRGVGALIVRDGVNLPAFVKGGGQERRRRGGTENVAGIVGFGAAAAEVVREADAAQRMAALRDKLEAGVMAATPTMLHRRPRRRTRRQHLVSGPARQGGRDDGHSPRPRRRGGQCRCCLHVGQGRRQQRAGSHGTGV